MQKSMLAQQLSGTGSETSLRAQTVCRGLPRSSVVSLLLIAWAYAFNAICIRGTIKSRDLMPTTADTAHAAQLIGNANAQGFPESLAWDAAPPIRFDLDWQGKNQDPLRQTEVRLLWTAETLFIRFQARYQLLTLFSDAGPSGRRDHLWDRDVCEVFLQPDPSEIRHYQEFEISPNGLWLDLDIRRGERSDLHSGMRRASSIDEMHKWWQAVLAIPIKSLVDRFDPSASWRVNFYRVEGNSEPRFYSAWRATNTPEPNFHVPEAFGQLIFDKALASDSR
jgi:alpha-galactosidase